MVNAETSKCSKRGEQECSAIDEASDICTSSPQGSINTESGQAGRMRELENRDDRYEISSGHDVAVVPRNSQQL